MHHAKVLSASMLWLAAILFMTQGSVEDSFTLQNWALFTAGAALIPTFWLVFDYNRNRLRDEFLSVLDQERGRTEQLVQAIACEFARAELPNLDARRSVPGA